MKTQKQHSGTWRWAGLFVALFTLGAGCFGSNLTPPEPVTLHVWRSQDTDKSFESSIAAYTASFPHVKIDVRVLKPEEYESELLAAWARGEGPDIFSVPNWRVGKYREFSVPMPEKVTLKTTRQEKKLFKTETIVEQRTTQMPTVSQIKDYFVNPVADDVVIANAIYGLPLSMDTLVQYYNRDVLARAQIAVPPTSWEEFRDSVQTIVGLDELRNVVQPAAAFGTASNVPYYFDLLSVLMMQNGTAMVDGSQIRFADSVDSGVFPGLQALDFYSAFSNPTKRTYTWNDDQLHALEAFTQGSLGFYFGYYNDLATIQERAPELNFSYAKLPQVDAGFPVNYAQYPVEMVHVNSENPDHAWNFLRFIATVKEQNQKYIESTERVPALKALVAETQNDPVRGIFAQQALTAKTWYHGSKPEVAAEAFAEMIESANERVTPLLDIVELGAEKVKLSW